MTRPLSDRIDPIDALLADDPVPVRLAVASFVRYHGELLDDMLDLPENGSELAPIANRVLTEFGPDRDELLAQVAAVYRRLDTHPDVRAASDPSATSGMAVDPGLDVEPPLELLVLRELLEALLAADLLTDVA